MTLEQAILEDHQLQVLPTGHTDETVDGAAHERLADPLEVVVTELRINLPEPVTSRFGKIAKAPFVCLQGEGQSLRRRGRIGPQINPFGRVGSC